MAFPFAAALMGLGAAGSMATLFGTGSGVSGMGRMQRALQAQVNTTATAQRYFEAAGDVTNPLFRRTAAMEESRLRRAIAEGVASSQMMARKARARGLTAGVRPEREDEARNKALASGYQMASERAGDLATERLMSTGRGILGVAGAYGDTLRGAGSLAEMETGANIAQRQKYMQGFDLLSMIGGSMGGGAQLNKLFAGPQASGYQGVSAPWAQFSGIQPVKPQFSWMGP